MRTTDEKRACSVERSDVESNGGDMELAEDVEDGEYVPDSNEKSKRNHVKLQDLLHPASFFSLQINSLLDEVTPKSPTSLKDLLFTIKQKLDTSPSSGDLSLSQAEHYLHEQSVIWPWQMQYTTDKDVMYSFAYQKPDRVDMVGSWLLGGEGQGAVVRGKNKTWGVDLALQMPESLFQQKDHLNNRYFHKRSFYLAAVAACLRDVQSLTPSFSYFNSDMRRPMLHLTYVVGKIRQQNIQINLHLTFADDLFKSERLSPGRNNVRPTIVGQENVLPSADGYPATPHYNSLILMDTRPVRHMRLFHRTATTCKGFLAAVKLCKVWCTQRAFDQWAIVFTALLSWLAHEGKIGREWGPEEIWRVAMWTIATHNFTVPLFLTQKGSALNNSDFSQDIFARHFEVAIVDDGGTYNLAWWASKSSLAMVQDEARKAIKLMQVGDKSSFTALFLTNLDNLKLCYDHIVRIEMTSTQPAFYNASAQLDYPSLHAFLLRALPRLFTRALTDRTTLVATMASALPNWPIYEQPPATSSPDARPPIFIGINLDPIKATRLVDPGPSADDKAKSLEFQRLWGKKAELRRFLDGTILEAVVWQPRSDDMLDRLLIPQLIIEYILQRHLGTPASNVMYWAGQANEYITPTYSSATTITRFTTVNSVFEELAKILSNFDEIPLAVSQILSACSELSQCSLFVPQPLPPSEHHFISPMDIVLEFESSTQWPNDLIAVQHMKIAFYIQYAELLKSHHGIITQFVTLAQGDSGEDSVENSGNRYLTGCLDIMYKHYIFRLRIHVPRNVQPPPTFSLIDTTSSRTALEQTAIIHQRLFVVTPRHTSVMNKLTLRYPSLSGTVRLLKRFIACHLFSPRMMDSQALELIAAHVFTTTHDPFSRPCAVSVTTSFARVLRLLATHAWNTHRLIVDTEDEDDLVHLPISAGSGGGGGGGDSNIARNGPMTSLSKTTSSTLTRLNDNSTNGYIVSSYATYAISLVNLKRLRSLAKAALNTIDDILVSPFVSMTSKKFQSVFVTPTDDYNLLIHLIPAIMTRLHESLHFTRHELMRSAVQPKSNRALPKVSDGDSIRWAGFDPITAFVHELERLYGSLAHFYYNIHGGNVIGVLFHPTVMIPRRWKIGMVNFEVLDNGMDKGMSKNIMVRSNVKAIVTEIQRLGEGIVERVEIL